MSYDPPDNIALDDAKEVLDDIENVYEEFENYSSVKHVNLDLLEKNVKKAEESKGFFGGLWGKLTQKIDDAADAIAEFTIEKMPDTSSMTSAVKGMFSKFVGNENGD